MMIALYFVCWCGALGILLFGKVEIGFKETTARRLDQAARQREIIFHFTSNLLALTCIFDESWFRFRRVTISEEEVRLKCVHTTYAAGLNADKGGQTSASFGVVYQLELRKYWRQVCDFSGRRREILWPWIVHRNLFEIVDTEILRESSFGV
ncbi:hypothetical protein ACFE04_000039 [Oxalis oulophora]